MAAQAKEAKAVTVGKTTFIVEPGVQQVVTTRLFDVPRERLFKAFVDPELIPQWWGGPGNTKTIVDKLEAKAAGGWRFVERGGDGEEYAFHGVFHELQSPERLVYTFEFEGTPGHVALETITLEDRGGKTFMTDNLVFQSVEDRDGMVQAGMQEGSNLSLDRLEALAKKII